MTNFGAIQNRIVVITLGVWLIFPPCMSAQEATWRIDPLHSAAHFAVRHLMISTVRGDFGGITGAVHYHPDNPAEATVEAAIDCTTLNTGVAKRDDQLQGEDFFDVKRYPAMKFKSKRVEIAGNGKLKVTGDLTINATTQQIMLEVEGPTPPVRDRQGHQKIGLSATTQISRKQFGITWNEIMESGGMAVADEVSITLDIELIKNTN